MEQKPVADTAILEVHSDLGHVHGSVTGSNPV
jgi:hypothetical protein